MNAFLPRSLEDSREQPGLVPAEAAAQPGEDQGLLRFQEGLRHGGLDLMQPFGLDCLKRGKVDHPGLSSYRPTQLGVVVGNTGALWPAFLKHLRGLGVRSVAELGPDPLDIYVEELLQGALSDLYEGSSVRSTAVYAHELLPAPIPIQRIAELAGLARVGPAHLSVHSQFGPWFALRAVVAFDVPVAAGAILDTRPSDAHPCDRCDAPCRRALSGALLHRDVDQDARAQAPPAGLSERQRRWLRVRDACPVGVEHRYTAGQILYHYDGKRDVLLGDWKQRA